MRRFIGRLKQSTAPLSFSKSHCGFCALLVLVQIHALLPPAQIEALYREVGLERSTFLSGKGWTLVTYGFFHHPGGLGHLLSNVVSLSFLGGRIEVLLGTKAYWRLVIGGLLAGGLFHLFFSVFCFEESRTLIGISGAVCALFAALTTLSPEARFWPLFVRGQPLIRALLLLTVFLLIVSPQFAIEAFEPVRGAIVRAGLGSLFAISHACHLGGFLFGILIGNFALRIPRLPGKFKKSL